jgi:hypothetical protein
MSSGETIDPTGELLSLLTKPAIRARVDYLSSKLATMVHRAAAAAATAAASAENSEQPTATIIGSDGEIREIPFEEGDNPLKLADVIEVLLESIETNVMTQCELVLPAAVVALALGLDASADGV